MKMCGVHVSFPELREFYNNTEISKAESIIYIYHSKFEMTSKPLYGGILIPVWSIYNILHK